MAREGRRREEDEAAAGDRDRGKLKPRRVRGEAGPDIEAHGEVEAVARLNSLSRMSRPPAKRPSQKQAKPRR